MFSIFNRDKDDGVPEWASFFTLDEYSTFISAVEKFMKKENFNYTLKNGVVDFTLDDSVDFDTMGLSNLAQGCKQHDITDYENLIFSHFEAMLRNHHFEKQLEETINNFEDSKQYLGVRIYNYSYISEIGDDHVIGEKIAGDLYAMLVMDLPESIKNVEVKYSVKWNKSKEELMQIGRENIKSNYTFPITKQEIGGIDFYVVITDHFFSSSILFDLAAYPELMGLHGSIISFPHRHTTLIYPIDNLSVVNVIQHMITMTYGMNMEGPGSISNKIYWTRNNKLSEIAYSIEDDKMVVTPSEEFVALLNRLGEQEERTMLN